MIKSMMKNKATADQVLSFGCKATQNLDDNGFKCAIIFEIIRCMISEKATPDQVYEFGCKATEVMNVLPIKYATVFKVIRLLSEPKEPKDGQDGPSVRGSPVNEIKKFFSKTVKSMDEKEKYLFL